MTQQFAPTLSGAQTDYLDGNGSFSRCLDPTQFTFFFDDFISCVKTAVNDTVFLTSGININWSAAMNGTGASVTGVTPADSGCLGSVLITTSATSGTVCAIIGGFSVNSTLSFTAALGTINTRLFDLKMRVAIPTTTQVAVTIGFSDAAGVGLASIRYDTSVPDSTWTAVTADGVGTSTATITGSVLDTNYHTMRIRSKVAGTILFSVDGGTEVALSTHIPTNTQGIVLQVIPKSNSAVSLKVDYVWGWIQIAR